MLRKFEPHVIMNLEKFEVPSPPLHNFINETINFSNFVKLYFT